jgi:hypothetical protein
MTRILELRYTREQAKKLLHDTWVKNEEFDEIVKQKAGVKKYIELAIKCREHDGNNNFKA